MRLYNPSLRRIPIDCYYYGDEVELSNWIFFIVTLQRNLTTEAFVLTDILIFANNLRICLRINELWSWRKKEKNFPLISISAKIW